jgi:hypothetical protein
MEQTIVVVHAAAMLASCLRAPALAGADILPCGGRVARLLAVTRKQALAILKGADFEVFVGEREDLELEFKGEPYQLDDEAQKFELAKGRFRAR